MAEQLVSLTKTVERIEREIKDLIERVLLLEAASLEDVEHPSNAMQDFDLVIQSLQAITVFLDGVQKELPHDQLVDIQETLKRVHLKSLAARLAGQTQISPISNERKTTSIELF
ncbi:MAG: hypothetical protein ABJ327_16625 [Litoreibacter sp.]